MTEVFHLVQCFILCTVTCTPPPGWQPTPKSCRTLPSPLVHTMRVVPSIYSSCICGAVHDTHLFHLRLYPPPSQSRNNTSRNCVDHLRDLHGEAAAVMVAVWAGLGLARAQCAGHGRRNRSWVLLKGAGTVGVICFLFSRSNNKDRYDDDNVASGRCRCAGECSNTVDSLNCTHVERHCRRGCPHEA